MAVVRSFSVSIVFRNWDALEQMKHRVAGFQEVFEAIIERWTAHNADKFEEARGAQLSGVIFDVDTEPVMWKGVTDEYAAEKTRDGFPNWLMVRTGELMASLTEPGNLGWYAEVEKDYALFGTILNKAIWHRFTRPVNFLDSEDRQMIRDMFGAYLDGEAPFRQYEKSEAKVMDAEFKSMFKGVTLPGLNP